MHQEEVFPLEGGWALEQALQGSGYSTKSDRVQEALGKCSQAHGVNLGVSCAGLGVGFDDSDRSVPTQHVLLLSLWRVKVAFNLRRVSAWDSVPFVLPVKFVCNKSSDRTG